MRKRLFLFGIIYFTGVLSLIGQVRNPQWGGVSKIRIDENMYKEFLMMSESAYSDSLEGIPFYYETQSVAPAFNLTATITNPEFSPLNEQETAILEMSGTKSRDIYTFTDLKYYQKNPICGIYIFPFRLNTASGSWERLISFELDFQQEFTGVDGGAKTEQGFATNSVLSTGSWYKISVPESGIYKITRSDLENLGIGVSSINPKTIRIFGGQGGLLPEMVGEPTIDDLTEMSVYVSGEQDGSFDDGDYVLFYGYGPNVWKEDGESGGFSYLKHLYATVNYYYINVGNAEGKRVSTLEENIQQTDYVTTSFDERVHYENNLSNLINSGKIWFGEVFELTTKQTFPFTIPDIVQGSPLKVKTNVASRSSDTTRFTISANGRSKNISMPYVSGANSVYATVNSDTLVTKGGSDNFNVELEYFRTGSGSKGWLDYITINARRKLNFRGGQMGFRDLSTVGNDKKTEFRISSSNQGIVVWDITDFSNVRKIQGQINGGTLSFKASTSELREFVVFDGTSYKKPGLVGGVPNQNLHALNVHDLFIVVPPIFLDQANALAEFRRQNDMLSVSVVTTDQVYNEFSSGKPDISAIRNFMKMFYSRAQVPEELPKYLLLFGNGTVDNLNILELGANYIPTFQTKNSWNSGMSYTSDDFFGIMDDGEGNEATGVLDLAVGRFPVKNINEADMVIDKVMRYNKRFEALDPNSSSIESATHISNYADWRNMVCFIADDEDTNTHISQADMLARAVDENYPVYNIEKIYLDAFQQSNSAGGERYPQVNKAINQRVNLGALLVNYTGHGGFNGLAKERIVTFSDISIWNNYYNLPVFLTATCEFSAFDHPGQQQVSAGVQVFLKSNGGASALLTTTRLAYSGNNFNLNSVFLQTVFEKDGQGRHYRLGDVVRITKAKMGNDSALKNFVLLGDPSMMMAYPQYSVVTESVTDTLKAMNKITVNGYVVNLDGAKSDNYNGFLYPTVFDKAQKYTSLANDNGSSPFDFEMQSRILYRGKVSIINGEFSFSFIVPKDISYSYGNGKISYYLDNGIDDGSGYYKDIIVGGSSEDFVEDLQGPDIDIYLNDLSFKNGDVTDQNPLLIALVNDESGINTTGELGHDLLAIIDDNSVSPYVLNQYYQATLDSYNQGRIIYPFYNLKDGPHSLKIRVWDIHNNPSEASLDFIVSSTAELALSELLNYPNPLTTNGTSFTFVHNFPFTELDVSIEIFSLEGRLLKTITTNVLSPGYKAQPISWDGLDESGNPLNTGFYLYRLMVTLPDGRSNELTKKLVVLR